MADVDQCVRECEAALCDGVELHAKNIFRLPAFQKVRLLRDKTEQQIITILENCKQTIQIQIATEFYGNRIAFGDVKLEKSSNNNRDGADVFHQLPNGKTIDIEVKFGAETNKAIGMAQFRQIFGTDIFTEALNPVQRRAWVALYQQNPNPDSQMNRLVENLNTAIDRFNELNFGKNYTLTPGEQLAMEAVIINNSGDNRRQSDHYLKFIVEGTSFRDLKKLPTGLGTWTILRVNKLDVKTKRLNVFVINQTTKLQIKYTLNWKNNYQIPGIGKVSAKLGFGAPSWNVWVEAELADPA